MTAKEYYASQELLWDDDSADSQLARHVAAGISLPRNGGSVLDIGCGTGGMFSELLENGAYEILGVDSSEGMISMASDGLSDARISLVCADFLDLEDSGFDLALAFNAYQLFHDPEAFVKKAHSLLNTGGRLTAACAFGRARTNAISRVMPEGVSRQLLPPWRELKYWSEHFNVDCMCDNEQLFLLSGVAL